MRSLPLLAAILVGAFATADSAAAKCAPDAAQVGPTCVDKYEASLWRISPSETGLLKKVRKGKARLADLQAGGATQVLAASLGADCETPSGFPATGHFTEPLYAVSVAGAVPSGCVTWFQAQQACALSGKRLISNEEWQRAVAGTPDPGEDDDGEDDCNNSSVLAPVPSGSRAQCVSNWGVADLIGNLAEWTADVDERATEGRCSHMPDDFGRDTVCIGGPGDGTLAAIVRGGDWSQNGDGGAFWLNTSTVLTSRFQHFGFRCAR